MYWSLGLTMNAGRSVGTPATTTAQNWLQPSRLMLKQATSCSAPKTSVVFWVELETPSLVAVAPATMIVLAMIMAPTNSQRRLPIYTLHSLCSERRELSGGACLLPRL